MKTTKLTALLPSNFSAAHLDIYFGILKQKARLIKKQQLTLALLVYPDFITEAEDSWLRNIFE